MRGATTSFNAGSALTSARSTMLDTTGLLGKIVRNAASARLPSKSVATRCTRNPESGSTFATSSITDPSTSAGIGSVKTSSPLAMS